MVTNNSTTCLRLRRLQQATKDLGLDGLIFVLGVDGSFNLGAQQAASYVLGQCSSRDVLAGAGQHEGLGVLVVTPVDVRILGDSYVSLPKQLLHHSLQLQVFTPTADELQDPDACEAAKIGGFVQMLRGLQRVGMPVLVPAADAPTTAPQTDRLPCAQQLSTEQLMELERCPLLMAYGMEGVGRSCAPFFTQCFQVHDVYEALQARVYAHLDAAAVHHALRQDAQHLQQHWSGCMQAISGQPATSLASLTEQQVAEPLQAFFAHGLLRPLPGVSKDVHMPPRVVFGLRTNDEHTHTGAATMATAPAPAGQFPATHAVLEAADGHSALRAARTYFFSTATLEPNVFADADDSVEGLGYNAALASWDPQPCKVLMRVYTALVEAARAGMQHFASQVAATPASVQKVVLETLAACCALLGVPQPALSQQLCFSLWQCDHANHVQPVVQRGTRQLKVLRLALLDVRAPAQSGASSNAPVLGGVVYMDTFLEVPDADGGAGHLLNLTEAVPAIVAWPGIGSEAIIRQRAASSFAKALAAAAGNKGGMLLSTAAGRAQRRARQQQAAFAQLALSNAKQNKPTAQVQDEDESDGDEAGGDLAAHWPDQSIHSTAGVHPLGALLTTGGGDEAVLLTGSELVAAEPGTLYCYSRGLVFVPHSSRTLWVLNFLESLEAISLQELRPSSSTTAAGTSLLFSDNECVVLRGRQPACGFPPACHLTTNTHVAIPFDALRQAVKRHMLSVVLPAWQQTCREGVPAANGLSEPTAPITYVKDAAAANPFSAACYTAHVAAVQALQDAGKVWPQVLAADSYVDMLLSHMDANEVSALSCGCWQQVEALLCSASQAEAAGKVSRVGITLVKGLPGADQALVAEALVRLIGEAAAAQVVYVTGAGEVQAAVSAGLAANPQSQHLVVVVEGFTPLLQHLTSLARVQEIAQGRCYLACVLGCVGALSIWQDKPRGVLQPGLSAQLPAGFLDAVVISASSAAEYKQVQDALQGESHTVGNNMAPQVAAAPHVMLRGGSLSMLTQARELLLPLQQERLSRLNAQAASRKWAYMAAAPQQTGGTLLPIAAPLHGPLQVVNLTFTGDLDVQALRDALQQLAGLATQSPAVPLQEIGLPASTCDHACDGGDMHANTAQHAIASKLLGVAGVVKPSRDAMLQQLVWGLSAAGSNWELRATSSALSQICPVYGAPAASVLARDVASGGELLLWGTGLHTTTLQALLQSASKASRALQEQQVAVTPATLSAAQIADIAGAHKHDPLPDGYTYDGSRYYDAFGDSSNVHPCFNQYLAEYCQLRNRASMQQQVDGSSSSAVHTLRITAVQHRVLTT